MRGSRDKMKRRWVKKTKSFKEAEKFERDYYFLMSGTERLENMQFLRELYRKFKQGKNENRKGLRGFIKVIQ